MIQSFAPRRTTGAAWLLRVFLLLLASLSLVLGSSAAAYATEGVETASTETVSAEQLAELERLAAEQAALDAAAAEQAALDAAAAEQAALDAAAAEQALDAAAAEQAALGAAAAEQAALDAAAAEQAALDAAAAEQAALDAATAEQQVTALSTPTAGGGANTGCDVYAPTAPDGDNAGNGNAPPDGSVGNADDKCPPGQLPDPATDGNNGYECDGNNGIGQGNPAHTACSPTLSVALVKTNDANNDDVFTDSEQAAVAGQAVDFQGVITNTSTVPVVIRALTDSVGGVVTDVCTDLIGDVLLAGATVTCAFTMPDYAPPAGPALVNTMKVIVSQNGYPLNQRMAQDTSSVTSPPVVVPPVLTVLVDKLNDASDDGEFNDTETAPAAGADVEFSAEITNDSDVDVVIDSISDVFGDTELDVCGDLVGTTIPAGESVTCLFTVEGYAPPAGTSLTNTVTVVVSDPDDPTNTDDDSDTSVVTTPAPQPTPLDIAVEKLNNADLDDQFTADETAQTAGQAVDFTAEITNNSTVPVEIVSIVDSFEDVLFAACSEGDDNLLGTVLEPGASVTCAFTLGSYSPGPAESLENTVTVTGVQPGFPDNTVQATDTSIVRTPLPVPPPPLDVVVDKLNDADGNDTFTDTETAPTAGATVEFSAKITNNSTIPVVIESIQDEWDTNGLSVCDELVGTTIPAGESVTCTFTLEDYAPAAGESLTNTVTVVVSDPEDETRTDRDDDTSTVNTPSPVPSELDIAVDKLNDANADDDFTDTETAPAAGSPVPFLITITNDSDVAVVITSVSDVFGATTLQVCQDLIGDTLVAGATVTCEFTLQDYSPAAGGSLVNRITVEVVEPGFPDNTDSDFDDSTVNTPPVVVPPVLSVVVDKLNDASGDGIFADSESAPAAAADVDFTATITNTSTVPVVISSITDVYGTTTLDVCADLVGDTLAAGASVTCTFTVQDYAPAAGDSLTNTVTVVVTDPEDPTDTDEDDDTSTVTTPPVRDLRIVKVDDVAAGDSVAPGEQFTYTLEVTNDGDVAETGFVVTDTLPAELTLVGTPSGTGFGCVALVCTYTGPAVQPGSSVSLTFTVTLDEDFEGVSTINTASVSIPPGDPTPENNTDTETTPVTNVLPEVPVRDLSITKQDSVTSVRPGDQLSYSLVVRSIGSAAVTGFTVNDTLPAGLSLVSVGGDGFACTGTVEIRCSYAGSLAPGASASITLVTLVAANYTGNTVVNTATVPLEGDPTPENNTDTETTPVVEVLAGSVPPAAVPPAAVPPAAVPPALVQPQALPFTGSDTGSVALGGLVLLLMGTGALVLSRRRPQQPGAVAA